MSEDNLSKWQHIKDLLETSTVKWVASILVFVAIAPIGNAIIVERIQFNKDRASMYHGSLDAFMSMKMAVWNARVFCTNNKKAIKTDPTIYTKSIYLANIDRLENKFIEKTPRVSIGYYFSKKSANKLTTIIPWIDKHKVTCHGIVIINDKLDQWEHKLFAPMRNKMYNLF